ncbi:MAG: ABC transporter permease [bacterium]
MKRNDKNHTYPAWLLRMAWRDSRTHRRRLLLFTSAIVLGIAALVSINSLGEDLERAVDDQAKTLLGADLQIGSRQPFAAESEALFDSLGGERSREARFSSMVYFPKNGGTRLARVRAMEGEYPYYGEFKVLPQEAARAFMSDRRVLVEESLLLQYEAAAGDSIRIGELTFEIAGRLQNVPGESAADAFIGPRVYLPLRYLAQTDLLQRGSQVAYNVYFKFGESVDVEKLIKVIKPHFEKHRLRYETVASQKEDLGGGMRNLYQFLGLVGFIALLLGCIGVASAVHVHIKQKLNTIAVLRCLGASGKQTFLIFLLQTAALGLIGSLLGMALGVYIQTWLPKILSDFLPVAVDVRTSWRALATGLIIGLGMTLLFALLPLLRVRAISPLLTLRSSFDGSSISQKDFWRWAVYALIAAGIVLFARSQADNWTFAIAFAAGLGIAFALLIAAAKLLMAAVKKFFPSSWSYIWRQSLANLYRPNNQTLTMMFALGLGTFLITTLFLVQETLLRQISLSSTGGQPNLVLFDIQSDQKEAVAELIRSLDLPVLQDVPVVTMRLEEINGRNVRELQKDSTAGIPGWALRREYRSSYRDSLYDNEKLIAGSLHKPTNSSDTIRVSLEESIAKSLKAKIGDTLVFDVQGVPVRTVIGSLREVNWRRLQPSFFILFPTGVLEQAPQFHVLVTRVPSSAQSAQLQRMAVQRFPNVSAIDITLVLQTADNILSKVAFVIRFMALFSILTGLLVLAGAVITSRYQRLQESVLLRTLGGTRNQILKIMSLEYLFLGGLAGLAGALLALAGSWALARFVFEATFVPALLPTVLVMLGVMALTILLGMLNSRGMIDHPPLEVLRAEG